MPKLTKADEDALLDAWNQIFQGREPKAQEGYPMMIVRVLDVKPHPDQATSNPGTWAVKLRITHKRQARSFWRWHTVRELDDGRYVTRTKPTAEEILAQFWEDTFADQHGFDFEAWS